MKIIWTPKKAENKDKRRGKANRDCYVCPYCGNNNEIVKLEDYSRIKNKEKNNLQDCIILTTFGASSFMKTGQVDCYTCKKCGTQWQSKIY